jgi:hypothetical protein
MLGEKDYVSMLLRFICHDLSHSGPKQLGQHAIYVHICSLPSLSYNKRHPKIPLVSGFFSYFIFLEEAP